MGKKVLLFVATEKGYTVLSRLIKEKLQDNIGAVVTFKEVNVEKSWDVEIKKLCVDFNILFYYWTDSKDQLRNIIKMNSITTSIAVSWKYMIPMEINTWIDDPFIVLHDSLLPKYRGFAPTPTAIICGDDEIGVTAIYASDLVDAGDIIARRSVRISEDMYVEEVIQKQAELSADIVIEIIQRLKKGKIEGEKQDEKKATYSIWRNIEDCHVDWGKSAKEIYNFVRALGFPYVGAFSYYEEKKIIIKKTQVISSDKVFAIRDFGKIWSIRENHPEIICGIGMIMILEATYEDGNPVLFKKLRCRLK